MNQITYRSEQPQDYAKELGTVETLEDLLDLLKRYETIAWDALDLAQKFDKKRFDDFLKALKKERKGIFSKSQDASVIMMPEIMFKVSIVAEQFKVPWGCAFIRLTDVGKLKHQLQRYYFDESIASGKSLGEK